MGKFHARTYSWVVILLGFVDHMQSDIGTTFIVNRTRQWATSCDVQWTIYSLRHLQAADAIERWLEFFKKKKKGVDN